MINKPNRFKGRRDPRIVLKHGKAIRGAGLQLKYLHSPSHDSFRVAVTVSTKVSKLAPLRNRIRRRVYEVIRVNAKEIPRGTDIVISVFDKDFAKIASSELSKNVLGLIEKIPSKKKSA